MVSDIPTLCHLEGLSDVGACRLCVVEVEGSPKLLAACATRVEEGMRVTTSSERLVAYRRNIVELFFVERNHICAVCVANNHCELQDQAREVQLTHFELPPLHPELSRRCHPRAVCAGPKPVHPVHSLRTGVR